MQQGIYDKTQGIDKKVDVIMVISFPRLHSYRLTQAQESALLERPLERLLERLHPTTNAGYRYGNRQGCLKGTREEVLRDIDHWFANEGSQRVFWLNGLAGTGKSTIAQSFAETASGNGKLGASFFCSRDSDDHSDLEKIFPTLAFQLACKYPHFQQTLLDVTKDCFNVG